MGTSCEIQLFCPSKPLANAVINTVITDIQRLEKHYSRYLADSLLSKINQIAAVSGSIKVDAETASLLDYAATCYQQSDGLFDITSGILRRVWRFEQRQLPEQSLIDDLLSKVGWDKLDWQAPHLNFSVAGMELDFGGIVKEYAADRAATLCRNAGIEHGVINLGGDIKIIGPRPDGRPWRVGLGKPQTGKENRQILIAMQQGGIASSGDYERCMVIDGVRYSHILNPNTGWPVNYLAAVSVVADFCVVAGSASTIAMLKQEDGPAWLESLGLAHFWIDTEGNQGGNLELIECP